MESLADSLPRSLKVRIARRVFLPFFTNSPTFSSCSQEFLVELAVCCKLLVVGKDCQLAHPGEPVSKLFVLISGHLMVLDNRGKTLAGSEKCGEMIGDVPFIFNLKHTVSITTVEESQLVCMQHASFLETCDMYPEEYAQLRRHIVKMNEKLVDTLDDMDMLEEKSAAGKSHTSRKTGDKASARGAESSISSADGSTFVSSMIFGQLLKEKYAGDLQRVLITMQQEQAQAKQALICNFLQFAADGKLEQLEGILAKGELQVDDCDHDQRTCLHLAVCEGHLAIVQCLIQKYYAAVHVKDRFGHTPIDDSIREGRKDIASLLMAEGGVYQPDAASAGQLCEAAFKNTVSVLQLVFQVVGVDPNVADYDRRTPLHLAASEGNTEVFELLVSLPNIDLSPKDRLGNTPLDDAIRHQHHHIRTRLQFIGGKMGNADLGVQLCTFAAKNQVERIEEIGSCCVPLDVGDYDQRTALHLAASEGCLESAAYLLKARVDPNPLDRFLCTPLDDALRHQQTAIEALLLSSGGFSGKNDKAQKAVARFKEWKETQKAEKSNQKLEQELKDTDVCRLCAGLKRCVQHPTFEDDVNTFISHSLHFRELLCVLLVKTLDKKINARGHRVAAEEQHDAEKEHTASTDDLRHKLMEQACAGMDSSASRIVSMLDSELIPWATEISNRLPLLGKLYFPNIKSTLLRMRGQLKAHRKLGPLVRRLWAEVTQGSSLANSTMLGILALKSSEPWMDIVHESRLQAATMLCALDHSSTSDNKEKDEDQEAIPDFTYNILGESSALGLLVMDQERPASTHLHSLRENTCTLSSKMSL